MGPVLTLYLFGFNVCLSHVAGNPVQIRSGPATVNGDEGQSKPLRFNAWEGVTRGRSMSQDT